MSSKEIIYILGTGRSGSTILATVLNHHEKINFVGELHHFFSYLNKDSYCSCGKTIHSCEFWEKVLSGLPSSFKNEPQKFVQLCRKMEYHSSIPLHMLGFKTGKEFKEYKDVQEKVVSSIDQQISAGYILDSAKYIGRFLALKKIFKNQVRGIFLIRDLRGVICSFKKNVQTQNTPFKTYIYYLTINTIAHFLSILPGFKILKIRYEDVVGNPKKTFREIGDFLELDLSECVMKIEEQKPFNIPHIIGGNRFKTLSEVTIKKDEKWLNTMPVYKKIFFFILALPLMIINKYNVLP
jgi:hypothetical protein